MSRRDLCDERIEDLIRWARLSDLPQDLADDMVCALAELKRLRENESSTRFLMAIEGEV